MFKYKNCLFVFSFDKSCYIIKLILFHLVFPFMNFSIPQYIILNNRIIAVPFSLYTFLHSSQDNKMISNLFFLWKFCGLVFCKFKEKC